MLKAKIPPLQKCKFQRVTVLAMGAGIGAACGYGLLSWWYAAALLPFLFLLNFRQLIYAASGFLLCAASGIIQKNLISSGNIPFQPERISGVIICTDRRTSGMFPEQKRSPVKCEIESGGKKFTAKALYPQESCPFYADRAEFTGIVKPGEPLGLICENNEITGILPPPYGDTPLVIIEELTPVKPVFSILRPILKFRETMVRRLTSGINDPQIAAIAAQICFGASPPVSREHRTNFIESGTIHLLSVSGMHVMIIAAMVLWLLKFLPFRIKHITAAVITMLYVLCTGAELPALRAGCMVIIWCVMRSMLIYSSSWQTLMWTWSIFVLIDPASCGTLSAQYSFGITAALILAGNRCKDFFARDHEILKMMPFKAPLTVKYAAKLRLKQKLFTGGVMVLTAFTAGCGLTLFRQHLFTPGSIPANLLLMLISPLLFGTFGIKLLAGGILPVINKFAALLMETVFNALLDANAGITEFLPGKAFSSIPLWSVILFYLGFFGTLGLKTALSRKICAFCCLLIFLYWLMPVHDPAIKVIAISTSSSSPALIAIARPGNSAVIVDVPDRESALAAGRILREEGIKYAEVIFSSGTLRAARGINTLDSLLDIQLKTEKWQRKPSAAFYRFLQDKSLPLSDIPSGNLKLYPEKRDHIKIVSFDGVEIRSDLTVSGREIKIRTAKGKEFRQLLPWCSHPVIWQCRIE